MIRGAAPAVYFVHDALSFTPIEGSVIEETPVRVYANGQEVVSLMCTPVELEELSVGLLFSEGLFDGADDIEMVEVSNMGTCVDVWLRKSVTLPQRAIRTSGCGGGITFNSVPTRSRPVPYSEIVSPQQIIDRYFELRSVETLYPVTRGVHASALCTPDEIVLWSEDVGRHNTLDKLAGKALLKGIDTGGLILVTTGRVSSEMLGKAARMGVPIVASRTSPTSRSLALADAWNITVVGYIRRSSMRLYSVPERISSPAIPVEAPMQLTT